MRRLPSIALALSLATAATSYADDACGALASFKDSLFATTVPSTTVSGGKTTVLIHSLLQDGRNAKTYLRHVRYRLGGVEACFVEAPVTSPPPKGPPYDATTLNSLEITFNGMLDE